MHSFTQRPIGRIVFALVAAIFIGSLVFGFVRQDGLLMHPRLPNPALQEVVPYNVKGVIHYVTKEEMTWIQLTNIVMVVSGLGFFGLIVWSRLINRRRKHQ